MTREEKERAIDTGYYKGMDLDAESYIPVFFEKVEDGYVLKFKDKDEVFEVAISSGLLSRLLRSLRTRRLDEIEKSEKLHTSLQPVTVQHGR
jgi:hypothetical protein